MMDGSGKLYWFSRAATALAVLSCYGTTVLIGLLSLLGVSLALDESIWAGAISLFAALATIAIAASYRRHRIIGPTVIAALGLGLILWVMYGSYSRVIELVGFVLLIVATCGIGAPVRAVRPAQMTCRGSRQATLPIGSIMTPRPLSSMCAAPTNSAARSGTSVARGTFPSMSFKRRISELADFKERELTLVCRTQMRSAKAAALLKDAGFDDARVLRGGMDQWNKNGLPVEERAGQPLSKGRI